MDRGSVVGHDVTMSTRPRAQDAETILSVVVGHSLDETCQHFPSIQLQTHAVHHRIAAVAETLRPTSAWKLRAISIGLLCVIRFGLRQNIS
jgi:hypothetical protein